MKEKLKKLIKLCNQFNKLILKLIEIAGTLTLLAIAIKSLIATIFGG